MFDDNTDNDYVPSFYILKNDLLNILKCIKILIFYSFQFINFFNFSI